MSQKNVFKYIFSLYGIRVNKIISCSCYEDSWVRWSSSSLPHGWGKVEQDYTSSQALATKEVETRPRLVSINPLSNKGWVIREMNKYGANKYLMVEATHREALVKMLLWDLILSIYAPAASLIILLFTG